MSLNTILTITALSLGLTTVQAYAQSEGAGDPFPFRAPSMVSTGHPFVADTGSAAYPQLTGEVTQPVSMVALGAGGGNEAPVQSVASLPRGFGDDTPAFAQTQIQKHDADDTQLRELASR